MPIPKPIIVQLASDVYAINEFGLDSIFVILVSYTDALFGRNAYQNHLRFTGSDLYMK